MALFRPLSPDPDNDSSSIAAATGDFSNMASPPSIVTDPDEPVTLLWRPVFRRGEGTADPNASDQRHEWSSEHMTFSNAMDVIRGASDDAVTIYRVASNTAFCETERTLRDLSGRRARNVLERSECFARIDGEAVRLRPDCMWETNIEYAPPQDPICEWENCTSAATWMLELACTLEFADHRCFDPWGQAGARYFGVRHTAELHGFDWRHIVLAAWSVESFGARRIGILSRPVQDLTSWFASLRSNLVGDMTTLLNIEREFSRGRESIEGSGADRDAVYMHDALDGLISYCLRGRMNDYQQQIVESFEFAKSYNVRVKRLEGMPKGYDRNDEEQAACDLIRAQISSDMVFERLVWIELRRRELIEKAR